MRTDFIPRILNFIEDFPLSVEANFLLGCRLILDGHLDLGENTLHSSATISNFKHLPSILNLIELYIFLNNTTSAGNVLMSAFSSNNMSDSTGLLSLMNAKLYHAQCSYQNSLKWYLISATIQESNAETWLYASSLLLLRNCTIIVLVNESSRNR